MGPSIHYNYDIHSLYVKIINDIEDSQLPDGLVPDIAPEYVHFRDGFRDSPEWGSASASYPGRCANGMGIRRSSGSHGP